jgi:hypothetical protein
MGEVYPIEGFVSFGRGFPLEGVFLIRNFCLRRDFSSPGRDFHPLVFCPQNSAE